MTPLGAIADGHVRYRDWHITVAQQRSDLSGLKLWLEATRIGPADIVLSAPASFGLIRVDEVHALQISLTGTGTGGFAVVPRSLLADAIVCHALQIHLNARTDGYTVALLTEAWLDGTDVPAELHRLVAAARTGVPA